MRNLVKWFFILGMFFSMAVYAETEHNNSTGYTEDKPVISVTAEHPQFVVRLKSNPTTGYSWFLRDYNSEFIKPIHHVFEAPANKKLMGAPGYEVWTFEVKPEAFTVPHQMVVRFAYVRRWEVSDNAKQVVFKVTTGK